MISFYSGKGVMVKMIKWVIAASTVLFISQASATFGLPEVDNQVAQEKLQGKQPTTANNQTDRQKAKVQLQSQIKNELLADHAQKSSLHDQIFAKMTNTLMPMSPEQISTLRELYNRSKKASAQVGLVPPRPTASSKIVDLSPGATPPVIRLASGYITSLVFLDASGAPWPIKAFDIGDPSSYNVQWDKTSSTMMVQAITEYKAGNLAVILEGLETPVMLTLMPGQRAVDYRVDVQIPFFGPRARATRSAVNLSDNGSLLSVLDGLPPKGGHEVTIKGGQAQAWLAGKTLYLRSRLTVLSPGWIAKMASADGTYAYEMPVTPVVLASQDGETVKLTLEGY
jgi:intracellular multiplication protein IcmK